MTRTAGAGRIAGLSCSRNLLDSRRVAEAVEIVAHLVAIERALAALAPVGRPDARCTLGSWRSLGPFLSALLWSSPPPPRSAAACLPLTRLNGRPATPAEEDTMNQPARTAGTDSLVES